MKPSSSNSEPATSGIFDGVLARGAVHDEVSDRAWFQAMLDVEAALARAHAVVGTMDRVDAESIARACRAENFDIAAIGRDATDSGSPVVPLVRALRGALEDPATADLVHRGATSQDVLDSAAMLIAQRALGPLLDDLQAAADSAAEIALGHRDTLMAGRTLLQHALPITFGFKAAGWTEALDEAADRLEAVRRERLAVQLGGAAGTLASLGDDGPSVLRAFAAELELAEPKIAWHTDRTRVGELAGALGVAAGTIGKVARDVTLMAQTEVAEVREGVPGRGGSSTLPHKRNPVAAVAATACAERAPALVSTLLASMVQEHERAAGAWHAEWKPFAELLETVGSAAAWIRDCLEHLEVDVERMRANLDLTDGLLLAERVVGALAPALGRQRADALVTSAAEEVADGKRSFDEALLDRSEVAEHLGAAEVARLLDPAGYLGSTDAFIDRVLDGRGEGIGRIVTRAVAVHHVVDGPADAPALVLSNSLGSTLEMWERQMPALTPHLRVIRYDLRGHGASPVPPAPYDIADLGADVLTLLDTLDVDRAHVGGLSIGGLIGMWVAANAPERVDRLVLCSTSPRFEPPEAWAARAATVLAEGTGAVADAVVARWFTPAFASGFPALVGQMRDMIAGTPPDGYAACCGVVERTDLRLSLPSVVAPTLVIAGADDPATPPAQAELIASLIPGARLAMVEHAAHLANVEQPDQVNTLILEHLLNESTFTASGEDALTKEAP